MASLIKYKTNKKHVNKMSTLFGPNNSVRSKNRKIL